MSYQERSSIVSLLTSIVVFILYFAYIISRHGLETLRTSDDLRFWGTIILLMIPVSIVARIITTIILNIHYRLTMKEEEPTISDERDEIIGLKGARIGHYVFVLGFVASMAVIALGGDLPTMFFVLLITGFLSDVINEISVFYMYRRGF